MNVLSLFDGMSTLQLAFKNVGIPVEKYYSSEVKKSGIEITKKYFPKTIFLGDIRDWRNWDIEWEKIDFIGSGSPCQDLSIAGKRAGIHGKRSNLFFVFVDILNHVKKVNSKVLFLQENVASSSKEDVWKISEALEILPVKIDSRLVTAQMRKRYYWTNIKTKKIGFFGEDITDIPQPEDRKIQFQDIIEHGYVEKRKAYAVLEKSVKSRGTISVEYKRYRETRMRNLVFKNKKFLKKEARFLTRTELERLQGFPDGYTSCLSLKEAGSVLGDGWTLPVIEHILSFIK